LYVGLKYLKESNLTDVVGNNQDKCVNKNSTTWVLS
jgi:hypothetical protein